MRDEMKNVALDAAEAMEREHNAGKHCHANWTLLIKIHINMSLRRYC